MLCDHSVTLLKQKVADHLMGSYPLVSLALDIAIGPLVFQKSVREIEYCSENPAYAGGATAASGQQRTCELILILILVKCYQKLLLIRQGTDCLPKKVSFL